MMAQWEKLMPKPTGKNLSDLDFCGQCFLRFLEEDIWHLQYQKSWFTLVLGAAMGGKEKGNGRPLALYTLSDYIFKLIST